MQKIIGLLISCLLLFWSCKSEKSAQVEEITITKNENSAAESFLTKLDNDYLVSIYEAQELIKIEQDDIELRRQYCTKAHLQDEGYFISMGIGARTHPETGKAIPPSLIERAAKIDAMRWAAYGVYWLENNFQPSFGKIKAQMRQEVQIINRANVGDSLFVFVATRLDK